MDEIKEHKKIVDGLALKLAGIDSWERFAMPRLLKDDIKAIFRRWYVGHGMMPVDIGYTNDLIAKTRLETAREIFREIEMISRELLRYTNSDQLIKAFSIDDSKYQSLKSRYLTEGK